MQIELGGMVIVAPARWRVAILAVLVVAATAAAGAAAKSNREEAARLYRESLAAYQAQDFAGFLTATRAALAFDPESPRFLYNLACGQALTGDGAAAVRTLERLAAMGLAFDLDGEADFASLRGTPGYANAVESMRALERPVGAAERAFTLDAPHFIPEGIARDPADGSFYLGSVHRRAIWRVGRGGRAERVAGPEAGLDAVLGMALDPARRVLWACSSALPEMDGIRAEDAGRAALMRFDLFGGKLKVAGRFELPHGGDGDAGEPAERVCNDLTVGPGGEVYVADSAGGGLFRLPAGGGALVPLVPAGTFRSPNGLALSADGRRLFVADYAAGLYAIDLSNGAAVPLDHPADLVLRGIDGLAAVPAGPDRPETLVAIQNGVRPHRVVRLELAADAPGGVPAVARGTVLLRAHPDFDEPTLGLVAAGSGTGGGTSLYFVANSHWGRFAADHSLPPPAELTPPVVLELPLPPVGPLARRGAERRGEPGGR